MQFSTRSHAAIASALLAVAAIQGAFQAQAAVAVPANLPKPPSATTVVGDARLNGFWFVDDAARSAANAQAKTELTAAGQEQAKQAAAAGAQRAALGVGLSTFVCGHSGLPSLVGTSEPWLLVVTKDEVAQYVERRQIGRRQFYTDGRPWPDFTKVAPALSGFSLAHWEGKELVIETVGLPPGGVAGRGQKGPDTLLTERVSVSADGKRLTWAYTWNDPVLMTKPVVHTLVYDRGDPGTYALTHDCDPNEDPARIIESSPPQE